MDNQYQIKNAFQKETLTKESYTNAWIEFINKMEKDKCVSISFEKVQKSPKTSYNKDGGEQNALADKEVRT